MKPKLKPCPFCGEKVVLGTYRYTHSYGDRWYVTCYGCGGDIESDESQKDAIGKWNRRVKR